MVSASGKNKSVNNNVLITSAGRRGVLAKLFQDALHAQVPGGQVYATDLQPELSSACQIADRSFATPAIDHPSYVRELVALCDEYSVGLLVPTIDTDLQILADHASEFERVGVKVAVSDSDLIKQCRDKRLTVELFAKYGVATPPLIDPAEEPSFPLIAKPFNGSSSSNLHVIHRAEQLRRELLEDASLLFFEYLSPTEHDEYTIDMYFDRSGNLRCLVPRLRIATRAGEVSKSRTDRFLGIDELGESFSHVPGARGCITAQFFVQRESKQIYGIEINARFGGGFPLTHEAGARFPEWMIREYLLDEQVSYFDDWEDQLTMLRYDEHVLVRNRVAA